jgi:hypothetical protein
VIYRWPQRSDTAASSIGYQYYKTVLFVKDDAINLGVNRPIWSGHWVLNAVGFAGEEEGVTDAFLRGGVGVGGVAGEPGFGGIWAKFCAPQADFSPFRSQCAALGARKRPSRGRATLHSMESTHRQLVPAEALAVDGTEMDSLKITIEGRAFDSQKRTELPLADTWQRSEPQRCAMREPRAMPSFLRAS